MNSNAHFESSESLELQRLTFLQDLNILDSSNSKSFDNLTKLAARLFDVPIVAVSLIDKDRQWFKSSVGLSVCETKRDIAFCDHVVTQRAVLNVTDAQADPRFANNPLVLGEPFIRSYLGIPLNPHDDFTVGSLCIIDTKPREFSEEDIDILSNLAEQVESLIRYHKSKVDIAEQAERLIREKQDISKALARYDALLEKAAAGIINIDGRGNIQSANKKLLDLLGYEEHELLGKNVKMLMPQQISIDHDNYLERYQRGVSQSVGTQSSVIGEGRELVALHKNGAYVPIHLAVSEVINEDDQHREFIGIMTDIREQKRYEKKMLAERALLSTLHSGITNFSALLSGNQLWEFLQESLRDLTESEFSCIGEVVPGDVDKVLKIHAMADFSRGAESNLGSQELTSDEILITNIDSLPGRVFATGETVMITDFSQLERLEDHPNMHAAFHNYLGIPIVDDGEILGMFAIANSAKVIDEELEMWLEPFTATCSLLIRFYRMVAEKEVVMEQLREAKDDMEAASRAKTEFLSSMSHELRTPLNSIIGFSQLMLSQTKNPLADKQRKQTEQIHNSGKHLLTLINEILDLSKIEAGKLSLSIEPANIKTIVDESIVTISPLADAAGITVSSFVDERVSVLADYTRVKQVLINLLSNSVKYNREQGRVDVILSLNEVFAEISVKDTGIGIDMAKVDELFEPFNRLGAENSMIEGTGVGLALTKKLVEYMNGEISVTSDHSGSTFIVKLPLAENSLKLVSANDYDEQMSEITNVPVVIQEELVVLYVEDNPANQYLMEEIFDDLDDLNLRCAHDPFLGFEMAKSLQPDLIILDINLPQIDGFELLKMIQGETLLANTPVIALSANAMPADIAKGLASGFDNYLTKPIDITVFLDVLQGYVSQISEAKRA